MKASLVLILAASAAVVGCTRASNPAVVSTPAVIERTTQAPAAGATAAPASCTWASQSFSSGATSCQNHQTYQCVNGSWQLQSAPAC